ncbi:toprim domain-containing protein [Mycoplasma iguanae]|uniref:Recombination protein RecR n=1 Tax=Mycoplasma iguanae TaxID=292461 RepID=A0ABY5R8E9_9MOLU|nr:toprim domain-containing protein [Mycoplasma iguanae]UVD81769.1 toprim domain-containing protein [Mycoplasma iguanae]
MYSPEFDELIQMLRKLPGIGKKQSEKIAFYIINSKTQDILDFFNLVRELQLNLQKCTYCHNLNLNKVCEICLNPHRNSKLMIIESANDLEKFEKLDIFDGKYYILDKDFIKSYIENPADESVFEKLKKYAQKFPEIIISLSPTLEGQIITNYLKKIISSDKNEVTQLAHGIPLGSQVEYIDQFTLKEALINRKKI